MESKFAASAYIKVNVADRPIIPFIVDDDIVFDVTQRRM
jgi:hypothetical protein